ncbi:hypothetical protein J6590_021082 [Homalodisca vitripennis]|nr:hypothetical protein J6590_021082 [Homalodisca vitripennis]
MLIVKTGKWPQGPGRRVAASEGFKTRRCDSQFQQYHLPLQGVQNHISVKENPVTIDSPLAVPNPPTLKDYGTIQEPLQNCTTLEVSPPLFSPTSTIPCRDDYPGPLEFEIFLDSATAHRRSWVSKLQLQKWLKNFIEDINDYEEEFWDDSDWEPFGEESDESENEFSSIKRSNKEKPLDNYLLQVAKKLLF